MHLSQSENILILSISIAAFLLLLSSFVITIVLLFKKKQASYNKNLEEMKIKHENTILQTQLEIQEQTFQYISREIHDNIGQKLTFAKLQLNTIDLDNRDETESKLSSSINTMTDAIADLSDLSRSMSSDVVLAEGLISGIHYELEQLRKTELFEVDLNIQGNSIFLDAQKDLLTFRIVQECINNIIKHACANQIGINLHYETDFLSVTVTDNGLGFNVADPRKGGNGLSNIRKRTSALKGQLSIDSNPSGTRVTLKIPIHEQYTTVLQNSIGR